MKSESGLRIAHVYNYLSPEAGGPPQVIAHLSAALFDRGHRNILVAHDPMSPSAELLLKEAWGERPLPVRFTLSNRSFFKPKSASLFHVLQKVDVVHLHSVWPPQCVVVSRVCKDLKLPYLVSLHGHLRAEALQIKPIKKALGLKFGYRAMLEQASAYHALNQSEKEDIIRFGLQGPIEVIANGIIEKAQDSIERDQLPRVLKEALGHHPYLLFLSRVHPPKGAKDLSLAFTKIAHLYPQLHLVVAGGNEDGGAEEVQQVAQEAGLLERIHLTGFIRGSEKEAVLQNASLFCLPSYHEGFSVAILEAMNAQVPICISEGCHFPIVAQEELGWTHACGSEALTEVLLDILKQPKEQKRRSERAKSWIYQNLTWSKLAQSYERLYQQIRS